MARKGFRDPQMILIKDICQRLLAVEQAEDGQYYFINPDGTDAIRVIRHLQTEIMALKEQVTQQAKPPQD